MKISDAVPISEIMKVTVYDIEEHFEDVGDYIIQAGIALAHSPAYESDPRLERLAGAAVLAGIQIGWKLHDSI